MAFHPTASKSSPQRAPCLLSTTLWSGLANGFRVASHLLQLEPHQSRWWGFFIGANLKGLRFLWYETLDLGNKERGKKKTGPQKASEKITTLIGLYRLFEKVPIEKHGQNCDVFQCISMSFSYNSLLGVAWRSTVSMVLMETRLRTFGIATNRSESQLGFSFW